MTTKDYYAEDFPHNGDIEHYLRTARMFLDNMEQIWRSDHSDPETGEITQDRRRQDALHLLAEADHLYLASRQIRTYAIASARFEHAPWTQIADILEVEERFVSEMYPHLDNNPQRGAFIGTLTTDD